VNPTAETRAKLEALQVVPPFPPLARKLLVMIGKPDAGFQQTEELIKSDAAVSAQVVRLANSPMLNARQEIPTVLRAIVFIGADRVKALAITAALKSYLGPMFEEESEPSAMLRRWWRENLVCALLAQEFAKSCWLDPDTGYTAGLLHDIGRLGLLKAFPGRYCELLKSAVADDADLLAKERDAFGVDHCTAGCWLADVWGFPPVLMEAIERHHDPPAGERFGLGQLIHASRLVATMMDFQVAGQRRAWDLEHIRKHLDTGNGPPFSAREDDLARKITSDMNSIECSLV
jgi:putative nucleotidyltransferase with HDIG domain